MDDDEQLSMKLMAKLELLEADNVRLSSVLSASVAKENLLESRITTLDSALESAQAEIATMSALEASQLDAQSQRSPEHYSPGTRFAQATPVSTGGDNVEFSPGTPATPSILYGSDLDRTQEQRGQVEQQEEEDEEQGNVAKQQGGQEERAQEQAQEQVPVQLQAQATATAANALAASATGVFEPWQSGGIKTQITDFMQRMEALERENDALKGLNAELQDSKQDSKLVQTRALGDPSPRGGGGGGSALHDKAELASAIAEKLDADNKARALTTDMAIVLSQQQSLIGALEAVSAKLRDVTRERDGAKERNAALLVQMDARLTAVAADLGVAQSQLEKVQRQREEGERETKSAKEKEAVMGRELERKRLAIEAMRTHCSAVAENSQILLASKEAELAKARLELERTRGEAGGLGDRVSELEGTEQELRVEKEKRAELEGSVGELLEVVEMQQRMLVGMKNDNGALHECVQQQVLSGGGQQNEDVPSRRFSTLPV
ncbi:hypothetical protein TeGR_g9246 [Tetraparma gracilis]|uniref:TATA element modulatory factor 1 TATA binding domain-containing protein n=1 Tax=Tetraparma gracilis TaxID=2962635 RepID=A0ABQ6MNT8_9STRA|nr:hypothetical protein TeGR_g9246 [Tetraparma gracilis]